MSIQNHPSDVQQFKNQCMLHTIDKDRGRNKNMSKKLKIASFLKKVGHFIGHFRTGLSRDGQIISRTFWEWA